MHLVQLHMYMDKISIFLWWCLIKSYWHKQQHSRGYIFCSQIILVWLFGVKRKTFKWLYNCLLLLFLLTSSCSLIKHWTERFFTSCNLLCSIQSPLSRARERRKRSSVQRTELSRFAQHSGAEMTEPRAEDKERSTDCLPWKCAPKTDWTPWIRWRGSVNKNELARWLPPLSSSMKMAAKTRPNIFVSVTPVCRGSHESKLLFKKGL